MQDIKKIMVPVDFFQHTEDLTAFAIDIAKKLGAQITFVHVVEKVATYSEAYPASFMEVDEELRGLAQKKMTALLEQNQATCPGCEGRVLRGDVADSLVEHVENQKMDLVIMGTHGAKGIEKILLGSVAERVLKRASCPILIFNPYKGERGYQITEPLNVTIQPV